MMITAKDWNHSDYQHNLFGSLEQSKQENLGIIELAWAHKGASTNHVDSRGGRGVPKCLCLSTRGEGGKKNL